MDTSTKLNLISSYQEEIEKLQSEKKTLIDSVMTDEIKQKLADIDAEFSPKIEKATSKMADLETEVRNDILNLKSTVKGNHLMAVWNKGRVSWDTKGLDGYLVAHPEIVAFRKVGDPTVTIRKI